MEEPQTPDGLDPRTREDLEDNEEFYQSRLDWRDSVSEGFMGSVLFPAYWDGKEPFEPSEVEVRLYHICMTEHGALGVEYAQEALHQNGQYFHEYFVSRTDSFEEALAELEEELERFEENYE